MAQITPEDEAAFNECWRQNQQKPLHLLTPWFQLQTMTISPLNVKSWQFWFRLENPKKPSVCSSRMSR